MSKNNEKPLHEIFDPGNWEHQITVAKNVYLLSGFEIGNILEVKRYETAATELYQLVDKVHGIYPVFRRIKNDGGLCNQVSDLASNSELQVKLYTPYANALILGESRDEALSAHKDKAKRRRQFLLEKSKLKMNKKIKERDPMQLYECLKSLIGTEIWLEEWDGLRHVKICGIASREKVRGKPRPESLWDIQITVAHISNGHKMIKDSWSILNAYFSDPTQLGGYDEFGK